MVTLRFTLLSAILLIATRCEKTSDLTGEYAILIGDWTSLPTTMHCGVVPGLPQDPNLELSIFRSGKYKLRHPDNKTETGSVNVENFTVIFKASRSPGFLHHEKIIRFNSDSLNIGRNGCDDDYRFRFLRKMPG